MKYYRVQEAADRIGVSASTLRKYTNDGMIKDERNPAGQRIFSQKTIDDFLGKESPSEAIVFYVRSSDGDNVKINNQIELLQNKYGEADRIYKDKASGLSEKRRGLNILIDAAYKGKFDTVCITQKDRLTRFGFTYLEQMLNQCGVKICVLGENSNKTLEEELLQDFMSLLASFSGKYYRLRGHQQSKDFLKKVEGEYEKK